MECMSLDVDDTQLRVENLPPFFVLGFIKFTANGEPFRGLGIADELDYGFMRNQGLAQPIHRYMAAHPMLYLVPFTGSWRKMRDGHGEARVVGDTLDHQPPQANPVYPLLPPPSAVTIRWVASGYAALPISSHQRIMLFAANSAVSDDIPTVTQPSFLAKS
jgi:hypothetical protein